MIPARKLPPFNFVLRRHLARTLRRRFHNVYLAGGERLRGLDPARPVVGCANHTNWWDGFVLYVLSHQRLAHDVYLAMEEKNLRRYRFFTWMGAFGVDLSGTRQALPGLRYALRLLRDQRADPARLAWIFVQGEWRRPSVPVEAKPGANFLARHSGASLLPVALRYDWLGESRPAIFIRVGELLAAGTGAEAVAATLNDLLRQTDGTLQDADLSGYEPLFPPAVSMNKRWDGFLRLFLRRRGVFDKQNDRPR